MGYFRDCMIGPCYWPSSISMPLCICTNQQDDKDANAEDPNHSSSADFEISADQGQPLRLPCGREVVKDIQR